MQNATGERKFVVLYVADIADLPAGEASGAAKARSAAAQRLARYAFAAWGIPQDAKIIRGAWGKPRLESVPFFFNLSHSGDRAICAVGNTDLGCDVEKVKPFSEAVVHRFFSEEEREIINRADASLRDETFCRVWTLRESYAKLDGRGLCVPHESYGFRFDSDRPTLILNGKEAHIGIFEPNFSDGYRYAVCAAAPDCDFRVETVDCRAI